MSIFEVGPARTVTSGDAWVTRVEVDPSDWKDAHPEEKIEFVGSMVRRYQDSEGNSAVDKVEFWGEGRYLGGVELFKPPRRTGPGGRDEQQVGYHRGPAKAGRARGAVLQ